MKYVIYPGTFDPIHRGHISVAEMVLKYIKDIDKFIFVSQKNKFKKNLMFTEEKRLELLNNASGVLKIYNTPIDIVKAKNDDGSFYNFIDYYSKYYDNECTEFYVIIGSDTLLSIHKWDRFKLLKERVKFIIILRGKTYQWCEDKLKELNIVEYELINHQEVEHMASTNIRKEINKLLKKEMTI